MAPATDPPRTAGALGVSQGQPCEPTHREREGRWPVWRLALLLYPFAAAAVAVNLFMVMLMAPVVGMSSLSPVAAIGASVPLGVPAAIWAARRLRALMDSATSRP